MHHAGSRSRLGWEWLSFGRVSWVHITYSWCDRFTQHSRTLVGWQVRSLYTTHSDSSRLGGAIAKPNTG
ncbi:MAG: hypothetical protein P5678_23875, partial [Limnospira sp. PMC 1240.20]|uniref:hypothetical protein n=1 Tax=Limnospira sp. PMC 1240.20 TaxID=2981038 RepID=UPI0028E0DE5C